MAKLKVWKVQNLTHAELRDANNRVTGFWAEPTSVFINDSLTYILKSSPDFGVYERITSPAHGGNANGKTTEKLKWGIGTHHVQM